MEGEEIVGGRGGALYNGGSDTTDSTALFKRKAIFKDNIGALVSQTSERQRAADNRNGRNTVAARTSCHLFQRKQSLKLGITRAYSKYEREVTVATLHLIVSTLNKALGVQDVLNTAAW